VGASEEVQKILPIRARKRRNILVVDDDRMMRELLELHLTAAGYNVALAEDAVVAGRMFLASTPDLLLIDINMPYMSGLDFVATLFADATVPMIPVVFMTAHEHFTRHTDELGADSLIKPILKGVLLATVARNLDAKGRNEQVAGGAANRPLSI